MRNEEWLTGGTFGINNIARPGLFGFEPERQPGLLLLRARRDGAARPRCCGGCCARPGARPSRRCATTRSAPRAWASTSRPTRCCRSRSARSTPASPVRCSRRWSQFIEPAPFTVGASIMMYLMVVVGGAGLLLRPAARLGRRRAAARVAALRAGLVPVRVRRRGGAADAVAARRPAQHSRPAARRGARRARPRRRAAAAAGEARSRSRERPPLLKVTDLKKSYGAIQAVGGVSLRGHAGRDLRRHRPQRLGQDDDVQQRARPDRRPTPAASS